jgi:hypothetical protein
MFFCWLTVVDDIAEVAEGNCASWETAMQSLRRHRVLVGLGMDKLNG